jgi:cellulose synthase/poly-beta-1,6-N-acetylglucosamine synthase-like glycosyltransferase
MRTYIYSTAPESILAYMKQRFRWGRGAPSAGLAKPIAFLKKLIVTLLFIPGIILLILYQIPVIIIAILSLPAVGLAFSLKFKIPFIIAIQLVYLKMKGTYAHTVGYVYEYMRQLLK